MKSRSQNWPKTLRLSVKMLILVAQGSLPLLRPLGLTFCTLPFSLPFQNGNMKPSKLVQNVTFISKNVDFGSPRQSSLVKVFGANFLHFTIFATLPKWQNETLKTGPKRYVYQ